MVIADVDSVVTTDTSLKNVAVALLPVVLDADVLLVSWSVVVNTDLSSVVVVGSSFVFVIVVSISGLPFIDVKTVLSLIISYIFPGSIGLTLYIVAFGELDFELCEVKTFGLVVTVLTVVLVLGGNVAELFINPLKSNGGINRKLPTRPPLKTLPADRFISLKKKQRSYEIFEETSAPFTTK